MKDLSFFVEVRPTQDCLTNRPITEAADHVASRRIVVAGRPVKNDRAKLFSM